MDFAAFLNTQEIILLDGAMETELAKRGLMSRGRSNLDAPEAVGGCCGTTPEHICAVAATLSKK